MAVVRWQFNDPAPGADPASYVVPINPSQMTSPFGPAVYTYKVTTAHDGTALVWEGQQPPNEWTFQGVLLDEAHYDALLAWRAKRSRTTITDHFSRVWTVLWSDLQLVPKRSFQHQFAHDYVAKAIILGGPA